MDDAFKTEGISNLSVIQTPSFVPKAAVPKVGVTLVLAFLASVGAAIGIVLLSDHLDETIHSAAGAERQLGRKVFVSLPCLVSLNEATTPASTNGGGRVYV